MILINKDIEIVDTVQDGNALVQVLAIETTYELNGNRYKTLTQEPYGVKVIDRRTASFYIPEYDLYQYECADVSEFAKPKPAVLSVKDK